MYSLDFSSTTLWISKTISNATSSMAWALVQQSSLAIHSSWCGKGSSTRGKTPPLFLRWLLEGLVHLWWWCLQEAQEQEDRYLWYYFCSIDPQWTDERQVGLLIVEFLDSWCLLFLLPASHAGFLRGPDYHWRDLGVTCLSCRAPFRFFWVWDLLRFTFVGRWSRFHSMKHKQVRFHFLEGLKLNIEESGLKYNLGNAVCSVDAAPGCCDEFWYGNSWGKLSPWCPRGQSHVVVDVVDQLQSSLGCLSDVIVLLSLAIEPAAAVGCSNWLLVLWVLCLWVLVFLCWLVFYQCRPGCSSLLVLLETLVWGSSSWFLTRVLGASSGVCARYGALTGWQGGGEPAGLFVSFAAASAEWQTL